jgi:hypothetical protein
MKVVAQIGEVTVFLIHVGDDERGEPMGVVVDVEDETAHRPFTSIPLSPAVIGSSLFQAR